MAIGNYLPSHDKERVAWFRNFINQFTLHAASLNFTPIEIEGVRHDCTMFTDLVEAVTVLKYGTKKRTGQKTSPASEYGDFAPYLSSIPSAPTNVPAGIFRRLSFTIRRIKSHPSYTETLGLALGIIGEEPFLIPSLGSISELKE